MTVPRVLKHLRALIFLGLRYVEGDIEDMRVSGYDVETMLDMADRQAQRKLGRWLLKVLPE